MFRTCGDQAICLIGRDPPMAPLWLAGTFDLTYLAQTASGSVVEYCAYGSVDLSVERGSPGGRVKFVGGLVDCPLVDHGERRDRVKLINETS